MKVKDLKKYIDDYIAKHSENDDVVFGYDYDDEFQVSSFSKRNLKSGIMTTVKEQYIKTCGWEYDCHTPGKSCLERCKHCPDGGIGYRDKKVFNTSGYGKSVLMIKE